MSPQEKSPRPAERDSDKKIQEIVDDYMNRIIGLARKRLSPALQQKIAPEDVFQSVLRTFYRRYEYKNEFHDLNDGASLWRMLAKLTVTRCWKAAQHYMDTGKRNINLEVPLASSRPDDDGHEAFQPSADELDPLVAMIRDETLERCFRAEHVDADTRRIIECWLGGASIAEIPEQLGVKMSAAAVRGLCNRFIRAVEALTQREDDKK